MRFIKKFLGAFSRFMRPGTSLFPLSTDAFWKFSARKIYRKSFGRNFTKTKLFAVKFRRISEVFALWGLWKKFWAQFHNLCVQKRSCFLWNSDACQKFSACKFCRKCSRRIITIFASKNEAICREVQTYFECFSLCEVYEKVLGAFSRFMHRIAWT